MPSEMPSGIEHDHFRADLYYSSFPFTQQVCDLQGVKCGNEYLLTDPVVHSLDQIFGNTDLGVVGIERVLAAHDCNPVCQMLGLQNPMQNVYLQGNITEMLSN